MMAFYGIPPAVQTASFQNQNRRDLQWLEEARNGAPLPPGIERITDFSFPTSRPPPSINGHRPFLSNVCKAVGRYSPPASPDAQSEATSGNHHQHNHRFPEPKPETPPYRPPASRPPPPASGNRPFYRCMRSCRTAILHPLHQALEAKPFTAHLRRPDRQLNSMKKRRDFRVTPLFCGIILPRTVCVSPQPVPGRPREKRSGGGTTGPEDDRFSAAAPGGPAGRGRSGPVWFPEQRRTFR